MTNNRSKLQITRVDHDAVVVLVLSGEIRLDDGDLALQQCVDEILAAGRRNVVLDLLNVSYIDSSGVGRLVAESKRLSQQGGAMRLARVTARSHYLLGTLKLNVMFQIYEDVDAALRSFA